MGCAGCTELAGLSWNKVIWAELWAGAGWAGLAGLSGAGLCLVGLGQTGLGEAILDGVRPEWIRLGRARLGWAKGSCVQSHSPGGLTLVDAEPIFGSAVATQGSETWNLGVGGVWTPLRRDGHQGPA